MTTTWAQRIKEYRLSHGLKQAALAELLGVCPTSISRWERGRDAPNMSVQKQLRALVAVRLTTVGSALCDIIDTTDDIAVLLDTNYRLVRASKGHQKLLAYDPATLQGTQFPMWTETMFRIMEHAGGPAGWWANGIYRMDFVSLRKAGERAANTTDIMSSVRTVTVRDSMGEMYRYAVTKTVAAAAYAAQPPQVRTFEQAV